MKHHSLNQKGKQHQRKSLKSVILTIFIATFSLGICLIAFWPKEFHGKTYLIVSPHEKPKVLTQLSPVQFGSRKFIANQANLVQSKKFLTKFAAQRKLNQRWNLTPAKTYGRLKRNTNVKILSKQRFVISFTSSDPKEAKEISNLIGKAYLSDWRSLNDDLFDELNQSLQSDKAQFRSNVEVKLAAYKALAEQSVVNKADYEIAKKELIDLRSKDRAITAQINSLKLERAIIASAARFDNHSENHTLLKSVNWKIGLGFCLLMSIFSSCFVGGFVFVRTLNKHTISPRLTDALSNRSEITLVPSNREQYAKTKPFDDLRQKILELNPNPQGLTISMVPCLEEEDAAGVSSQLAKAFADAAYPTLLVEGNLSNPRLHTFFDASPQPGLVELLKNQLTLQQTVIKTQQDNLWLLPGGLSNGKSSELLSRQTRKHLIEKIRSRFDVIIFNNAPILSGIDSLIMIGDSDLSYVCTAHDQTSSALLAKTRNAIKETGGHFGGLVLTRLNSKQFDKVSTQIEKALI